MALSDQFLVVGAPADTGATTFAGAVYVYATDGRHWRLTASDGTTTGSFGRAVAIDGDLIVVGAPGGNGAAYAYRFNGADWVEEFRSRGGRAPGTAVAVSGDRFVASVSFKTIDGRLIGSGSAQFFRYDGTNLGARVHRRNRLHQCVLERWLRNGGCARRGNGGRLRSSAAAVLRARRRAVAIAAAGDWARGSALALAGDVLLAGVPGDSQAGNAAGAVYQLYRTGTDWVTATKLIPPGRATGARFGTSVALHDDALIAGAPFHSQGPGEVQSGGAAFLFRWRSAAWSLEASVFAPDAPNPLAVNFARALALGPDLVLVGAPQDDDVGTNAGAAFVFTPPWPVPPPTGDGGDDEPPPHAGGPPPGAGGRAGRGAASAEGRPVAHRASLLVGSEHLQDSDADPRRGSESPSRRSC
jgi:hypothetical protein